jgi:alkylation response protein AidB-like acyl-CoA dehydrogenase
MNFNLTEEQEMLRKAARDFFNKELPKSLVKEMAKDTRGYTPELWNKMAGLGWMGLIIPEKYGGSGVSFLDLTVLLEEMGRACLPGPFFSTAVLGVLALLEAGSEEQKQRLLPKVASGKLLLSLAFSEPDAINSPDLLKVKAKAIGDKYSISGTKLFVSDAHVADYLICVAKTEGGVTLFLVDTKSSGLSITLLPTVAGDKQCEVKFKGVEVGKGDILGKVGQGSKYMEKVLAKAAVARCAEMTGGAQQVLEMTVNYAKERVQFGSRIGVFQAVQHHCANMVTDVEGIRFITNQAAWMLSEGMPCTKEVSMAKAWVSEAYRRVTALGHQVHGAIAFQQDHDMHLYTKQAGLGRFTFGDVSYHEEVVARELGL